MHYSDIRRHITRKKYLLGYCIMILTPLWLVYLAHVDKIIIPWDKMSFRGAPFALLFFGLPTLSIYCILINSYRCRFFYKFYNNCLKKYDLHFRKIMIEKGSYKIDAPYISSYKATVYPPQKTTNAIYLETDNYWLLFFSVSYWGIFQVVLRPFIFIKPDKDVHINYKNVTIIQKTQMFQSEQGIVIDLSTNRHNVKRVIIPPLGLK